MLNRFAKFLLVATSLSPILGAVAVNQYSLGKAPSVWVPWLVVALLLIFICWGLLRYAAHAAQTHTLKITHSRIKTRKCWRFSLPMGGQGLGVHPDRFRGRIRRGQYPPGTSHVDQGASITRGMLLD